MTRFTEDTVELVALKWLRTLGYKTSTESDVMPDDEPRERPITTLFYPIAPSDVYCGQTNMNWRGQPFD
jgi:hypothetical protein